MSDEQSVRRSLDEWSAAFCAKDLERFMALYATDAEVYDAMPPWRMNTAALREKVQASFASFPDTVGIEAVEVAVQVGGDLAAAHRLWHFTGLPPGHPAGDAWLRSTLVWQQRDSRWRIVHDHRSVPFDPATGRTAKIPEQPPEPPVSR